MGYYSHRTIVAVGHSTAFKADVSGLMLRLEGTELEEQLYGCSGRNGHFAVTLLPHGGKHGSSYYNAWLGIKIELRKIATRWKADWLEAEWGADYDGIPAIETKEYRIDPRQSAQGQVTVREVKIGDCFTDLDEISLRNP